MSTRTLAPPAAAPPPEPPGQRSLYDLEPSARRRRRKSTLLTMVLVGAVAGGVAPLVVILWQIVANSGAAFGWEFLTRVEPLSYRETGGGYLHGIWGTVYMTGMAALMVIPLGIAAAVYLVDFTHTWFARVIRFFTDVMTGVPSIFVGLAVYALLVTHLRFGTFTGAVALGIIMLPIIVRTAEEMLLQVPPDLRSASFGLGARQWQTTLKVVIPAAGPGILTGVMLAIARGAGETAPLILTALGARQVVYAIQAGNGQADIGLLMSDGLRQPFAPGIERAWAGGLTLISIVLVITIVARLVNQRSQI